MDIGSKFNSRKRLFAPTHVPNRAVTNWVRILERPTTIQVERLAGTALESQTVRMQFARNVFRQEDVGGETISREVVVYGVRDHPDTDVLDTILLPDDVFRTASDGTEYIIEDVLQVPGGIQAIARWSSV